MSAPKNCQCTCTAEKDSLSRNLRQLREELWGPIPPHERRLWSDALLDNPQTDLNTIGKLQNMQLYERDGIVMNRLWVAVARYWDDQGLTAYEWLLQRNTLVDIAEYQRNLEREQQPTDPWGDCTEQERREWTTATVMFPPQFLGATVMGLHNKHAKQTGITNSKTWIDLALEFRAAGFTPAEFIELNTQVRKFHKRGCENTLVTTTWGTRNIQYIHLDAQKWTNWLERYRTGEDPEVLTKELLEPHWVSNPPRPGV